ncbi:uncharacterized protein LOC117640267 [Thrips palmi]|uniref:Uncharacterized protein LOC117640267 n=1 Tax=Thrips palmi TaxID=161013 RepID=A0A6P8YF53_THRPL|nr:uncharacterized protein LOC117640267 [Thrips palmi]
MVAVAVLLHAMHLLSLPEHLADLEGGATPRNVLLFRDAGLLILLVVLQWLVSLHLASRRRPLPGWLRSAYRALAVLRTPLLLPAVPASPNSTPPARLQPPDEESVGLSEVSDRLALLAVGATYLALVVASLP